MLTRNSIVALATVFFAALQGCQTEQALSASGDRSADGKGKVSFRLSQQNVQVLNQDSYYLQYKVSGPGMDSMMGYAPTDTAPVIIQGIPCGRRLVQVSAMSYSGIPVWYGADTVEVDPNRAAFAHISLHKLASPYGTLVLDISLDSIQLPDSLKPRKWMDTTWSNVTKYGWSSYTYDYCENPTWAGPGDSLRVKCTHVTYLAFPGDTTWVDTVVRYPVPDTAYWCTVRWPDSSKYLDSASTRAQWTCFRAKYEPYTGPVDTTWFDSLVNYPVDSTPNCYLLDSRDPSKMTCTRLVYRPTSNCGSSWQDTLCGGAIDTTKRKPGKKRK